MFTVLSVDKTSVSLLEEGAGRPSSQPKNPRNSLDKKLRDIECDYCTSPIYKLYDCRTAVRRTSLLLILFLVGRSTI
jgi:hypothetical protein